MKRTIAILCGLCLLLTLCTAGSAEERITRGELAAQAAADFPAWTIWRDSGYASGCWNDEAAVYATIEIYRIVDDRLENRELTALLNPLRPGDRAEWQISDYVSLPLTPEGATALRAFSPERIFGYHTQIQQDAYAYLAPAGLSSDEKLVQLLYYSEHYFYVVRNASGQERLVIVKPGAAPDGILSTPWQDASIWMNDVHSCDLEIELDTQEHELLLRSMEDGWRLACVTVSDGRFDIGDTRILDMYGYDSSNNDAFYYGRTTLAANMTELDFAALPRTGEEMLASLDSAGFACTRWEGAEMLDAPHGDALARCYARVAGEITAEQEDWVCLRIGDEQNGLLGWFSRDALAFGVDMAQVHCTFPSYEAFYDWDMQAHPAQMLNGDTVYLDVYDRLWLIGVTAADQWLVLADEGIVCLADKGVFTGIGPACCMRLY